MPLQVNKLGHASMTHLQAALVATEACLQSTLRQRSDTPVHSPRAGQQAGACPCHPQHHQPPRHQRADDLLPALADSAYHPSPPPHADDLHEQGPGHGQHQQH